MVATRFAQKSAKRYQKVKTMTPSKKRCLLRLLYCVHSGRPLGSNNTLAMPVRSLSLHIYWKSMG